MFPELNDTTATPDPSSLGAPLAPSLNLSADQVAKFGLADLPQGSTITARVTFKVGGAGGGMGDTSLEAVNFSEVAPVEGDGNPQEPSPGETEGTSADTSEDIAEGENPDEEEKVLGYRRVTEKKKAPKLNMKGLQSRF